MVDLCLWQGVQEVTLCKRVLPSPPHSISLGRSTVFVIYTCVYTMWLLYLAVLSSQKLELYVDERF